MPFLQDKKTEEAAKAGMGRAVDVMKKKPDTVDAVQKYAMEELRKEEEKKKKKKDPAKVDAGPSKGMLQRLYESVMGSSDKTEKK